MSGRRSSFAAALLAAATAAALLAGPAGRAGDTHPAEPLLEPDAMIDRVLELADERLALMPAVAAAKWPKHLPIADPAREVAVVAAAGTRARERGLEPRPVERLMELQIRLARAAQERLYAEWNATGFAYTGPSLDLARDLRPRLDRLSEDMIEALYLAASAAAPAARAAGREGQLLPATRWSDADRAELEEAIASVRHSGPASLDRARAAGVLRVGTPADYAPFSVGEAGRVEGADIELARQLAAALSLEVAFVHTSWRTLLADLRDDRFDIAVGGISVTPAREAVAAFTVPLARSGKTAIGRCADAARFGSLAAIDRPGVAVIVNPGGTNETFAYGHLHAARLVMHADNRTMFEEIVGNRADVMFTDETEVALATHRHPGLCRLLAEAFEPADKAVLVPKDGGWREAIDPWLHQQLEAGVPARLLTEYLAH